MHRTTFINKNGDVINHPFYPNNDNNNLRRMCSINNGQGRVNLVVGDFGSRLYLRRIIKMSGYDCTNNVIATLDDILSVPLTSVTELY